MSPDTNTETLYVAIDIGKNVNWIGAYAGATLRVVQPPHKVLNDRPALEQLSQWLRAQQAEGQRLLVGHEPTGIYHEPWAYQLQQLVNARLDYRWLNPFQVKERRRQLTAARGRKSDALDVYAIAHCLRDGLGQPPLLREVAELHFEGWGRAYRQTRAALRRQRVQLLTDLDRLWPGALLNPRRFAALHPELRVPEPLARSHPLERAIVQAIVRHAPDPHTWRDYSQAQVQQFFRQHVGRCGPVTAARVQAIVARAPLLPPAHSALLAARLQADFAHYERLRAHFEALEQEGALLLTGTPGAVLTTIPGLSPLLAARLVALMGHPQRFADGDQLWAYAGFDPRLHQSGDRRVVGPMTRRGDPALRDTLYLIGLHCAQQLPALAAVKQRAQARGLGKVGATVHVAHKVARLCVRLLQSQQPFDPLRYR